MCDERMFSHMSTNESHLLLQLGVQSRGRPRKQLVDAGCEDEDEEQRIDREAEGCDCESETYKGLCQLDVQELV